MRSRIFCIIFLLLPAIPSSAQELRWGGGMDYFFDNMEYKASPYADARTLQGIWLDALGGAVWDSTHTLVAGVNLLKMPGMQQALNKVEATLYYKFENDKVHFRVGAFPRQEVLSNYSDFFFRDSVNQFIPLMQGIFWQLGKEGSFFNAWMDWTGYSTAERRESFFLGFSGKASRGLFFVDFQSDLFHLAGNYPNDGRYGVSEVIQGIGSAGIAYEQDNRFRLMASAGLFAGIERERKADVAYYPLGFTARLHGEYMGFGTENNLYAGDPRMRFFSAYGSELYRGNPFLQGAFYLQSRWYIRLIDSRRTRLQLNCNLHFSEGEMLFQQTLALSVEVGNLTSRDERNREHLWMRLFQ